MDPLHKTYLVQVHSTNESSSDSPYCIHQMPSHLPTAMFGYLSELFFLSSSSSPQAMKAMLSDPDTLSFDQAMQGEDKDKWLEAAQSEISQLTEKMAGSAPIRGSHQNHPWNVGVPPQAAP